MKPTTTLATSLTPDGEPLILLEHDGHHYMKVGGVPLMGTHASSSEKEMADLACANLPPKPRVLIGGLGFGYTLRRVLELCPPDATVDVAELLQVVVDWNRDFLTGVNGLLIDDPRVHVHIRDVAEIISRAGDNRYHAILLDVDNDPIPFVQKGNRPSCGFPHFLLAPQWPPFIFPHVKSDQPLAILACGFSLCTDVSQARHCGRFRRRRLENRSAMRSEP